ncbi:hypothetical protein ACSNOK_31180 [Streptomyces sp. URMC 126]|uniref:hypothetical protein n=1 Tax=Streptomyces sp. URMC 126 TaxID=3423401 RepID=UPI003F1DDE26
MCNAVRQTGGAPAVAVFGALLVDGSAGEGVSLTGMRESLWAAGGLLGLTTVLTVWLLRRDGSREGVVSAG